MRNPLKSAKKLRDRFRRPSRSSQDLSAGESSTTDVRSATPESDPSLTPTPTPKQQSDEETAETAFQREESPPAEKKTGLVGGWVQKGKAAMDKSVTFAQEKVSAASGSTPQKEQVETETPPVTTPPLPPVAEVPMDLPNGKEKEEDIIPEEPAPAPEPVVEPVQETVASEETHTPTIAVQDRGGPSHVESAENEERKQTDAERPVKVYDVHGKTVVIGLLMSVALFWLFVIWIFGVGRWETALYSLLTFALTLGYCYLYSNNVTKKQQQLETLNVTPGVAGLRALLKDLPTWLSYTKKEKVEWLNKGLSQMWPAYDKAVCDAIKESVEPIVQSVKPPIFKDISFSRLKFGAAPFRVESVEIYDITETEIVVDLDIRWCGDANITLAIEPNIPSMTEVTRMAPKVSNISCFGTIRLILKPLVSEMPGFGAVIATFVRSPTVNFHIDFGKALGGSVSGNMVRNALDSFIRDTIINMYVWPQRCVIPIIYDEEITGRIEDLQLRHVGVLTVKVLEARDLPAADMNGYSDPTIELWTRPEKKYNTVVQKKTLNPVWEKEVHNLLIQEPRSQNVSVTAYDVDFLNVSDVLKSFNVVKNLKESVNAKEFLGRAWIPVRPAAEQPGTEVDGWYDLGANNFGHPDGPGTGCGKLHMKMVYTPFSMLNTQDSTVGTILVTVIRCRDLIAMDRGGTSDPYVKIKVGDKVVKTHVVNASCDPEFHVNFEFFDVPIKESLSFTVFDKDFASRDDPLGELSIAVQQLASSVQEQVPGSMRDWFQLRKVDRGEILLKLQYIPMDTTTHLFN